MFLILIILILWTCPIPVEQACNLNLPMNSWSDRADACSVILHIHFSLFSLSSFIFLISDSHFQVWLNLGHNEYLVFISPHLNDKQINRDNSYPAESRAARWQAWCKSLFFKHLTKIAAVCEQPLWSLKSLPANSLPAAGGCRGGGPDRSRERGG